MRFKKLLSLFVSVVMLFSVLAVPMEAGAVDYSGLTKSQEYFLRTIGSLARADYYENDILASVTLSQAIFESGWGSSALAAGGKNLFGIKAFSNWKGKVYDQGTSMIYSNYEEFTVSVGQSRYNDIAAWRGYATWLESVNNHSAVLAQYSGVPGETNYRTVYEKMVSGGYCTDPGYVNIGCNIIEDYGLTSFDNISADSDGIVAITSNEDSVFLDIGEKYQLSVQTYPANKTPSSLKWTSDDTSVATVDQKGVVTAKAHGMTLISATLANGREACCIVSVDCNGTVMKSDVYVYTAPDSNSANNGYISSGTSVNVTDGKTYSDSLGNVYYWVKGYNSKGKLVSGYVKANNIFMNIRKVSGITVAKDNITVKKGDTYKIAAAAYPCDADDTAVKWSSDNTNVATVDQNGVVTAKALGTAVITASNSGGAKREITVTVSNSTRTYKGLVSDGPVSVRSSAGYNGSWKGEIPMFGTVTINGEAEGFWYNVSYVNSSGNTVTGYMNAAYVRVIPDNFTVYYKTLTSPLSVYADADLTSAKYGDIASGEKIAVIGTKGTQWSHVVGECTKGYAIHGYAALNGISDTTSDTDAFYGRVLANASTVRNKTSQSGTILGKIPKGSDITIMGKPIVAEGFTWYKVKGKTADGKTIEGYADSGASQSKSYFVFLYKGLISVSAYLNVRASASSSSSVVGQLYNNDIVTAVGEAVNGWYNVEYVDSNGKSISGYCSSEYMSLTGKLAAESGKSAEGYYGKILASASTVRETPSQKGKVLGKIPQGTQINIIGYGLSAEGFLWYRVSGKTSDGTEIVGYADTGAYQNKRFYVFLYEGVVKVDSSVNVRASASTSASVVGQLYNNDTVTVLGEAVDGWYNIEYTNSSGAKIKGYCSADYLTLNCRLSANGSKDEEDCYGRVLANASTVRKTPSQKGTILGRIPKGNNIKIIGYAVSAEGFLWYKVSGVTSDGKTVEGYADSGTSQGKRYFAFLYEGLAEVDSSVNVRDTASTGGKVIGQLYNNDKVTVIGESVNGWYNVEYTSNGTKVNGYCSADYINLTGRILSEKVEPDVPQEEDGYYGKILTNASTVRKTASQKGTILGKIPKGTEITIIGEAVDAEGFTWYKIKGKTADGATIVGYADSGASQKKRYYVFLYNGLIDVDGYVNIRASASSSGSVVGKLYNNDMVTAVGEAVNGWYNIEYVDSKGNKVIGYCSAEDMNLRDKLATDNSQGTQSYYGKVLVSASTVRKTASQKGTILGKIAQGTQIKIIGYAVSAEGFLWYKVSGVSTSGTEIVGYADSGILQNKSYYTFLYEGIVNVEEWLNVRSSPSTSSSVVGYLYGGDKVMIVGEAVDGWYQVEYTNSNGTKATGYCSADYIIHNGKALADIVY